MLKAQSAMEYLTTYGWSILILAIVVVVLFQLGVFNRNAHLSNSCNGVVGFSCSKIVLQSNGWLSATVGAFPNSFMFLQTGCSTSATQQPTNWSGIQANIIAGTTTTNVTFPCTVKSNTIGTPFTGTLWIRYNNSGQPTTTAQVGTVTAQISSVTPYTTIVYTYSGSSTSSLSTTNSLSLPSGSPTYICVVATSNNLASENFSGNPDFLGGGGFDLGIGPQTAHVCTASQTIPGQFAMTGAAINTASYTLTTWGSSAVSPFVMNYNVADPSQTTLIFVIQTTNSVSATSLPWGCGTGGNTPLSGGGFIYMITCDYQIPGVYHVSLTMSGGTAASWAAYAFG